MRKQPIFSMTVVVLAAMLLSLTSIAMAEETSNGVVSSTRSFPSTTTSRRNLTVESTSIENTGTWGDVESLNVPRTKSQAEKDAEVTRARLEQEAAQNQTVNRSEQREPIPQIELGSATGTGADVARFATGFQGYPYASGRNTPSGWDCSGFVQYVYSKFGVNLPHYSGAQATVGTPVASLSEAQPGDIVANNNHAAIYIGNGMVMNALNPGMGTQITGLNVFHGGYSIRRVL